MKKLFLAAVAAVSSLTALPMAKADPAQAEDDAYSMAVYYTQRGYAMSPTNHTGVGGSGYTVRFLIPVSKGLDYVFLVGKDAFAIDIDAYVYDEVGNLILDDRRPPSRGGGRAGVKFRSSYNGTVQVYVHMARADGMGAYAVLVGRRGAEKGSAGPVMDSGPIDADALPVAP